MAQACVKEKRTIKTVLTRDKEGTYFKTEDDIIVPAPDLTERQLDAQLRKDLVEAAL